LAERLVNIFDVSIEVLKIRMEKEELNIKLLEIFKKMRFPPMFRQDFSNL